MSIAIRLRFSVVINRGTKFLHNTYKFLNGSFRNFKFFGKARRITGIPFLNKPVNGLQAGYKCFGHCEERFYEIKGLVSGFWQGVFRELLDDKGVISTAEKQPVKEVKAPAYPKPAQTKQ